MERVRKAGLVVAYGTRAQNMAHWLPQVAPAEGDIKIVNTAQDRFYNTDLDKLLYKGELSPRCRLHSPIKVVVALNLAVILHRM
jgi:hypothetical protein